MFPTNPLFNLTNCASRNFAQRSQSFWRNAVAKKILDFYNLIRSQFGVVGILTSHLRFVFSTIFSIVGGGAFIQMRRIDAATVIAFVKNHIGRKVARCNSHRKAVGGNAFMLDRNLSVPFGTDSPLPIPTTFIKGVVCGQTFLKTLLQNLGWDIKRRASQPTLIARLAQFKSVVPDVTRAVFNNTFHTYIIASEVATA